MQEVVGSNPTLGSSFFLEKGKMGCLRCCCVVCRLYCLITALISTSFHVCMLLHCSLVRCASFQDHRQITVPAQKAKVRKGEMVSGIA